MLCPTVLVCLLFNACAFGQKWPESGEKGPKIRLAKQANNPFSSQWNNSIAICAIMRKENTEDIREWLQYHRYIGVDQVLLYDNNADGGQQAAQVADFIQDGFLTYYTVPGQAMQVPVYQHCLEHSAEEYTWLAAIDIDEYLVVEDEGARYMPRHQRLKSVLRDFRFYPALFLQWKGFGPGTHRKRPEPGGPLAHYTHCMPLAWPPKHMKQLLDTGIPEDAEQAVAIVKYGKSIANRFWTSHASTAHGFMYWGEGMPVTDAMQRVAPAVSYDKSRIDHAQISFVKDIEHRNRRLVVHHYATRSYDDYLTKLKRGAGDKMRTDHLRGTGFFTALNASTYEDPSCKTAVHLATDCCRDSQGLPWPQIPSNPPKDSYVIHKLRKEDVPRLHDLQINRGQQFRDNHYPPFPWGQWKARAAICARWDRSTDEGALREWLDHHRYIGVDKVALYLADYEPKPSTELLQQYPKEFLLLQTLKGQRPDESEAQYVRRHCIDDNSSKYAFITFLHTHDYLMPRGQYKNREGELRRLLGINEFRYSPGVVLPVFEFGRFDMPSSASSDTTARQLFPLRHFKDCTYLGHHLMTRTIANTYYVDAPLGDMDFKFVHGMLPITDTRVPWVPQLIDIPTDDPHRLFQNNITLDQDALEAQLSRFHLTKPFGGMLAVFSFPPESAEPLPGDAWRHRLRQFITQLHSSDKSCGEAVEAADTCCPWEESKESVLSELKE